MKAHFVSFLSPGTFVHEETTKPIESWDVEKAKEMARGITERHDATPFGFRFSTRERKDDELDSKVVKRSGCYYLGGRVMTLADVKREMPNEHILIGNMECNGYDRIIVNTNSWKIVQPLNADDVVLEFSPAGRAAAEGSADETGESKSGAGSASAKLCNSPEQTS